MTDTRDDKDFEAFLSGDPGSELTNRYADLSREEPPPDVDARILAEARHKAEVRRRERGPRGGWLKPVALAATVLLSFSVVMNLVIDTPARFEQVATTESTARRQKEKIPEKRAATDLAQRRHADQQSGKGVEEIAVSASRKRQAPQDVPMSLSAYEAETQGIDIDAALDLVADYVATGGGSVEVGRLAGEAYKRSVPDDAEIDAPESAAPPAAGAAPESGIASGYEREVEDDPESSLRKIARLHASGSTAVAGEQLEEFLDRYPDHPISIDIRRQGYRP